ncbi:MAG: FCD domain-containing protein [Dysgonamonadaceae bacterium]|nr:FCD domain-containing protein [Dysgonamonadaceae bacterium]MDD4729144.1 FCD domain-containing protein [Dysgonamonadaceae bacterium]
MCENREQQAVKELLLYIKNEKLFTGDRLPSERTLSDELSVSRSTIRVALKTLQANGSLESRARSGYYLKSKNIPRDFQNNGQIDDKSHISDSLEAFYLFEPIAVALATERMNDETLELLEQCLVNLSKAFVIPDINKIVEYHQSFHEIIISATDNDFIIDALQRFELAYELVSDMMSRVSIDQRNQVFALHVNLFNSIKERTPIKAKLASEKMIISISNFLEKYEGIDLPKVIRENQQVLYKPIINQNEND